MGTLSRGGEIKKVQLTQGYVAIVDAVDYPLVAPYKWHVDIRKNGLCYAATSLQHPRREIRMHQLLTGEKRTDHRDGDGLNNRRTNLRRATQAQNTYNSRPKRGELKGVTHQPRLTKRPWQARICIEGKQHHLGYYKTSEEAAAVYDREAERRFGEFARLNGIIVQPSRNHRYSIVARRLIPAPDRGRLLEYKLSCGHTHWIRAYKRSKVGNVSHCKTCLALEAVK